MLRLGRLARLARPVGVGRSDRRRTSAARAGVIGAPGRDAVHGRPDLRWVRAALATRLGALRDLVSLEAAAFDLVFLVALALGLGVILYFGAPEEPGLVAPAGLAVAGAAGAFAVRARRAVFATLLALACLCTGFAAAKLRTLAVTAPVLARAMTASVTGVVVGIDLRVSGGARLVLRVAEVAGLAAAATPRRIRLTVRRLDELKPGDAIAIKAALRPPSAPVVPGGYDFARDAFFDGIGGVGFAVGKPERLAAPPLELAWNERFLIALDAARNALTLRIATAIGGENGAVAASQVTGKRSLIPDEANDILRAAGLYHVVSISGLHMALFAGGLFWLIRALLALSTRLALTAPLKTTAALASLLPAAAYTIFSGAEVATLRSFLMTSIVLLAVALRRSAVTRRNVAIAACIVMVTTPEQVLGPSFQMSFAAVSMMVAWYDRPRPPGGRPLGGLFERVGGRLLATVVALAVTTLIASVATAPFASFHFHKLTLQSLAANLLATPIVTGLIMPLALAALLAEPFGYGTTLWSAMGTAVGWFMAVARLVATWPGSDLVVAQAPVAALAAFSGAVLMLAILRTRLAWLAAVPAMAGLALMMTAERPVAIVGANGHAALVRQPGGLHLIASRKDRFAVKEWLLVLGERAAADAVALGQRVDCDGEGCSAPLGQGRRLILDKTMNAVEEDCGRVAVLVSPLVVPDRCREDGHLVLDKSALGAAGSVAIYEEPGPEGRGWRVVRAREPGVVRPWSGAASAAAGATPPVPPLRGAAAGPISR